MANKYEDLHTAHTDVTGLASPATPATPAPKLASPAPDTWKDWKPPTPKAASPAPTTTATPSAAPKASSPLDKAKAGWQSFQDILKK